MKNPTVLSFILDNDQTDFKAKIWAIGVLLSIPAIFILGIIGLPLSILGIILWTKGLNKKDGILQIVQHASDSGIVLFKSAKTGLLEEQSFIKKEFTWHYLHSMMGKGGTTNGTTHINYITLMLTFHLKDNQKIGFIEHLYPWQEIPQNWSYNMFDKADYTQLFFTSGLIKFKENVDKE